MAFDEKSQAQSFLKEFFDVFGVDTVTQATFEHRVKFADGSQGFVDCFWPGTILVEMKSKGKDLDVAYVQAMDYVKGLINVDSTVGRVAPTRRGGLGQTALPRAIVVSDFQTFRFYDLTKDAQLTTFKLADLRKYVTLFGYMIGGESEEIREQDPVNRKAAEKMAKLHDALKTIGYAGRELEVYLVRLLFCLFAEDTSIFQPDQFSNFIRAKTAPDGSDLGSKIAELFQVLNTPPEKRLATRDEAIVAFPYVNGNLFGEMLQMPAFSAAMRTALLECGALDWSKISPAIFGAMFQGVMDETKRHDLGAHYTSEENILKVIRPLFLDRLREEFDTICLTVGPSRKVKLAAFHDRLAALKFLDPACGCGNFLLIAYRELRRLEMDVLEELHKDDPGMVLDVSTLCKVNVSQFYGIEIEPFPAEIAKVALWLMDHLCNLEVADRFGQYFARIPIKASPHIVCANALTTDWGELLNGERDKSGVEFVKIAAVEKNFARGLADAISKKQHLDPSDENKVLKFVEAVKGVSKPFDYIFGNPPFLGFTFMNAEQKAEMLALFPKNKNLDFVCGWYKKANDYFVATASSPSTRCAFVSTNSITQGETAAFFWPNLNVEIDFAYRTFKWHNEAKDNAAVHCVIIGFHAGENVSHGATEATERNLEAKNLRVSATPCEKIIYDGDTAIPAKHINCYLMDAPDIIIESRNTAIYDVPKMVYGNKPTDGGNLFLTPEERDMLLAAEPQAAPLIRQVVGSEEFINRKERYCLWLVGANPVLLAKCPLVKERIEKVRQMRLASKKAATRKKADVPQLFDEVRQPLSGDLIVVPRVSSERRQYVPIGFMSSEVIATDLLNMIPSATLYHFGVLTSRMHNAWMRAVCGRLKSDYRYSKDVVYNNFIWPAVEQSEQSNNQIIIAAAAQAILDVRQRYLAADPACTLAILYNPETMPPDLLKAHQHLDALVDKQYGKKFASDAERVAHLFDLYAAAVKENRI